MYWFSVFFTGKGGRMGNESGFFYSGFLLVGLFSKTWPMIEWWLSDDAHLPTVATILTAGLVFILPGGQICVLMWVFTTILNVFVIFLKTGTNFQESFLHPRVIIVVIMIIAIIVIKFFLDAFKLSLIRGCSRIKVDPSESLEVTYQNLPVEKYKINGKRISSIRLA